MFHSYVKLPEGMAPPPHRGLHLEDLDLGGSAGCVYPLVNRHKYGKLSFIVPFFLKNKVNMVMFFSCVSLPEGILHTFKISKFYSARKLYNL